MRVTSEYDFEAFAVMENACFFDRFDNSNDDVWLYASPVAERNFISAEVYNNFGLSGVLITNQCLTFRFND